MNLIEKFIVLGTQADAFYAAGRISRASICKDEAMSLYEAHRGLRTEYRAHAYEKFSWNIDAEIERRGL